ncbi:unnamed protein product [Brassica oleracea var. botrytis]|uniref:Uncharacterized protein n=2 Tax=Brassica TaxID=3705 RepID=A0A0D3B6G8_BRAOL|nr:unnamed protein product [Brassica napus]CDY14869.1 BnaC04g48660D [Brassica napus]
MLNHPSSYFLCHPSTETYPFDRWRPANDFGSCAFSLYSRNLHVGLGSTFTGCTHSSKLTVITVYAFLYGRSGYTVNISAMVLDGVAYGNGDWFGGRFSLCVLHVPAWDKVTLLWENNLTRVGSWLFAPFIFNPSWFE